MVTKQDIESFTSFAIPLIDKGQADSMAQLLKEWEAQREHEEVMDDIRQGIEDAEAGLDRPAREVIAEVRKKLGLTP
jgi:predicted transcriptional regulator